MKQKWLSLALCLTVFLSLITLPAGAEREPIPELLRFRQETKVMPESRNKRKITRTYPDTANPLVNREIARIVDRLAAEAEKRLPDKVSNNALADTGATVYLSGTKTVSFLVLAHTDAERKHLWSGFETAVYDLKTGSRLTLDDVFTEGADETIRSAVRDQLNAYFPDVKANQAVLERICREVRQAPFTLSPAYLQFHYSASELYRGRTTLMHVRIPYRLLTDYMTDYARAELDNSNYLLAALTFDDGPGRGVTANILDALRSWCARGTFFNLGRPMANAHDYVAWEHDAGHAVQSHTYTHTDRLDDRNTMFREKDRFAKEQAAIIGIEPSYMRAPGGNDKLYAKYEIGMPIVRWTTLSGDAVDAKTGEKVDFASTMVHTLKQTSVILMHNIAPHSVRAANSIMTRLYQRGYLCVTVDELFEIRGMPMQDNIVYFGDEADQRE